METFEPTASFILLKFADGMIHDSPSGFPPLDTLIPIMTDLNIKVKNIFENSSSVTMSEIENISSSIRLLLDSFEVILNNSPTSSTYSELAGTLIGISFSFR
jgi:hypothetical protein